MATPEENAIRTDLRDVTDTLRLATRAIARIHNTSKDEKVKVKMVQATEDIGEILIDFTKMLESANQNRAT